MKSSSTQNTNEHLPKGRLAIVFILILIILIGALLCIFLRPNAKQNKKAIIYRDGEVYMVIDLATSPNQDILIGSYDADYNLIHIENGDICITKASCPDKLCRDMGYASDNLVPIVCLPNNIVIELISNSESGFDAITY